MAIGTFWLGEGVGLNWPIGDWFIQPNLFFSALMAPGEATTGVGIAKASGLGHLS